MSKKGNDVWIESAIENFTEAVGNEDWKFARSVIGDVRDKGYVTEAENMERRLAAKKKSGFVSFGVLSNGLLDQLRTDKQKEEADVASSKLFSALEGAKNKLSRSEMVKIFRESLGEEGVEQVKFML